MAATLRLALAAALFAGAATAQDDPEALSRLGRQAMAEGRFADAATIYARLEGMFPGNPGLLLNRGMALSMAGDDAAALAPLERAISLDPGMFPGWLFLGASRLRLGRLGPAAEALERAVALDPTDLRARRLLGEACTSLGRHARALMQWEVLAGNDPRDPAVWALQAQAHEALAAEAVAELERAAPESAFLLRLLADARLAARQYPSALFLYRLALERDPRMPGVRAAVARIYRETGHEEWARQEEAAEAQLGPPPCPGLACDFAAGRLEKVASAAASDPETLYWRARARSALAELALQRIAECPDSAAKYEALATVLADRERFAESAAAWKRALAAEPSNRGYAEAYATQLYLSGAFDEARPHIEALRRAAPSDARWSFFLGDIALREQNAEAAVPLLERAVALDPALTPARAALGRALLAAGEPARAVPQLEAALELDQDGSLHFQLAQAYQRGGRRDEARALLEKSERLRKEAQALQAAAREMEITGPPPPPPVP